MNMNRIVTIAALAVGGVILSKQFTKKRGMERGSSTKESIDVDVPVSTAYNQWTQFEDFPKFMSSVKEVRQVDDTHLHWRAEVAGKEREWDAEITEQIPDKRIAWRSMSGPRNAGVVTFHKLSNGKTRIMLQMDYEPESMDEKIGDTLGLVKMQTKANLTHFKEMLEGRGRESGAWRGSVAQH
ncbi:MAG TPA: SRPBCC family protein [Noviherbaspirillum sp.]|uniref:SRPBCC family protein n=1 Tax=Noviherbaspirillum sp. TaxID=1926288 RepID=UPI002B4830A3|nr:SRPBCC family protein [Noviherbaspirillum sp.]HJV87714.1 SRPBCC family protein [Noviherbaspirillum sp.]